MTRVSDRTFRMHQGGKIEVTPATAWALTIKSSTAPVASDPAAVRTMAPDPIAFAMANPTPEVRPEQVRADVAIMATGRSDHPNQISSVLAVPGVFRGVLDVRPRTVNEEMKPGAARAIAGVTTEEELQPEYIVRSVSDRRVAGAVAVAVARADPATQMARRETVKPTGQAVEPEAIR